MGKYVTVSIPADVFETLKRANKVKPCCENCGSENILAQDCTGYINGETGEWEMSDLSNNPTTCMDCARESTVFDLDEHIGPVYIEADRVRTDDETADYILKHEFTRGDDVALIKFLDAVLDQFAEHVIPQGVDVKGDNVWDEINTAMAWLCEDLGVERPL